MRLSANEPLRNRHLKTPQLALPGMDAIESRTPLLGNDDLLISIANAERPMEYFYRNTGGDELLFIHTGDRASSKASSASWPIARTTTSSIPTGTTYPDPSVVADAHARSRVDRQRHDSAQVPQRVRTARRARAVLRARLSRAGAAGRRSRRAGEYEVRVTNGGRNAIYIVQNHPCDVVGWDGYCYPYAFNLEEFAPITGKLHQPPPAHATFEAPGAAFCAFVPRLFDYHPLAIPVPYNHSSVDCDEVLYYVSGNFMSRRGVEEGSITLHAAGAPHGPQPGAVESSLGKTSTDEIAVMVDTFKPLAARAGGARMRGSRVLSLLDRGAPSPV